MLKTDGTNKALKEIYISTDIETDGPIPGPNSMLSFASAAFTADGEMIDTFEANLELLDGAQQDPKTMQWWASQPEAYKACRENLEYPEVAMQKYVEWLKSLNAKTVFVGYPATFDFMFVYWYLIKFTGKSPFSFSAIDMKTYAMAILGTEFRKTAKKTMPKIWFSSSKKHTHIALDDAIEQGELFCNMMKFNLNNRRNNGN